MNKKGVLFTVFVLLFLSALLLVALSYVSWIDSFKQGYTEGFTSASLLSFIQDDVTQDYMSIYSLNNLSVSRSGSNVSIAVGGFVNTSKDYVTDLTTYQSFIEGDYSTQMNVGVTLEDVVYGIEIQPFNVHTSLQADEYYVYIDEYDHLLAINVSIVVYNQSELSSVSSPSSESSGTLLYTTFYSSSGEVLLQDVEVLDGSSDNGPFALEFDNGDQLDLEYGEKDGKDGVLWVEYDPDFSIESMNLVFEELNESVFFGFNSSISVYLQGRDLARSNKVGLYG
jgi:hypothetical protein